jgi:hypothetical protein
MYTETYLLIFALGLTFISYVMYLRRTRIRFSRRKTSDRRGIDRRVKHVHVMYEQRSTQFDRRQAVRRT